MMASIGTSRIPMMRRVVPGPIESYQAAEKRPSAALSSSFVVAAPEGASLLRISGALHLAIFEQPDKKSLFSEILDEFLPDPDADENEQKEFGRSHLGQSCTEGTTRLLTGVFYLI